MYKSAIIGSNGYLGRHLAYFLEESGFDNSNFDVQIKSYCNHKDYKSLDVTQKESFRLIDPQVDCIFLFSGLSGTLTGFDKYEEFVRINELGLLNLLAWMRESGCNARIVFPSSRLVYKGLKDQMLKEEDRKETRTIYAINKLAAENMLWLYQNAFGINYTVFRICVPYGNNIGKEYSYGTMGFFIESARKNKNIFLYGDGSIRRTFTHVEDICRIIINAIKSEKTKNQIYNIGGENLSLLDTATIIAKRFGAKISFSAWPDIALKLETGDTIFDDSKLRSSGFAHYAHRFSDFANRLTA